MIRNGASFVLAPLLFVALGLAILPPPAGDLLAAFPEFSAPSGPASPSFQAAQESKPVSRIDRSLAGPCAQAPTGAPPRGRFGIPGPATHEPPDARAFPPLFSRPPPATS